MYGRSLTTARFPAWCIQPDSGQFVTILSSLPDTSAVYMTRRIGKKA